MLFFFSLIFIFGLMGTIREFQRNKIINNYIKQNISKKYFLCNHLNICKKDFLKQLGTYASII